jgi:hypothetical protein
VPGHYQCERFDPRTVTTGDRPYAGTYQSFNIFGTTEDGSGLSLQAGKALGGVYYSPSTGRR